MPNRPGLRNKPSDQGRPGSFNRQGNPNRPGSPNRPGMPNRPGSKFNGQKSPLGLGSQYHLMNFYNFKKLINLRKTNLVKRITKNKILSHLNRRRKLLIVVQMLLQVPKNLLIEHFQIVQKNQERQIGMIVQNLKH